MTSLNKVYNAFLSKVLEDEYAHWTWEEVTQDLEGLLEIAIAWFKFPRHSLEYNEHYFVDDLTSQEIQILATYMKVEWTNRCIMSYENIKPLYEERDFSQANLLDKLGDTLERERTTAKQLEAVYYRSRDKKPFNYSKLAGG
jgi:predicted DNA-binding protein YlxM (UPF0122 family)